MTARSGGTEQVYDPEREPVFPSLPQSEWDLQPVILDDFRVREQFARRAVGDEFPGVEDQHARADIEDQIEVVRRDRASCRAVCG